MSSCLIKRFASNAFTLNICYSLLLWRPFLRRPLGTCPVCPFLNPALVGMNRSIREGTKVKRFERSNGLDTALYKTTFTFFLPVLAITLSCLQLLHTQLSTCMQSLLHLQTFHHDRSDSSNSICFNSFRVNNKRPYLKQV